MKYLNFTPFLFLLVALKSNANYICTEINNVGSSKKELIIELLGPEKVPYANQYDYVSNVKVTINEIKGSVKFSLKKFTAISVAEDVNFKIDSVKQNGFRFWMYLDEPNQDGMELTYATGLNQKFRLNCKMK